MSVELTIFTKRGGPLTKKISLAPDGKVTSDGSCCTMARGTARRKKIKSLSDLASVIAGMKSNEALSLGALREDLPADVGIVTKDRDRGTPGVIARTTENVVFTGAPALALFDFDQKGMPPEVAARLAELGGFARALGSVMPAMKRASRLIRQSTSAGLYRTDTGERFQGSGGVHAYIIVAAGTDIPRFLSDLHERCWLAGLGWMMTSKSGALLERSIIDKTVGSPERLVFEGPPVVEPPLAQAPRKPVVFPGGLLDTMAACPPLSAAETAQLKELKQRERLRMAPEAAEALAKYVEEQKAFYVAQGHSPEAAREMAERLAEGLLLPDVVLEFDDPQFAGKTVRDVIADPERYLGATLADPIEGAAYGKGKAKILRHRDGTIFINSFAHGGMKYELGDGAIGVEDFYAYMPSHQYIYTPTRQLWPGSSVNSRLPPMPLTDRNGSPILNKEGEPIFIPAAAWLDKNRPVEQMSWQPGLPQIVKDRLMLDGGWTERYGANCFNLYIPAPELPGDPEKARHWIDHIERIYPGDARHLIDWFAHRVQRPEEKINHAIVLGGDQGIGKDTILDGVKHAIGAWNFQEASPAQVMGRFNSFLRGVIVRISEARDLGDYDRFVFYDHMKAYTAAPPDVLRVDEKFMREYPIANCCGVIITTNHKTDGIFLPEDDRRHYVAWSESKKEQFDEDYWDEFWEYYESGGYGHVAAFLRQRDLGGFNPKKPPPKTEAWRAIIDAGRAPEEAEIADLLESMGNPDAVTLGRLQAEASTETEFGRWINDRKSRRSIAHRLESAGYVRVGNPDSDDGRWKVGGFNQVVYVNTEIAANDRLAAVRKMINETPRRPKRR